MPVTQYVAALERCVADSTGSPRDRMMIRQLQERGEKVIVLSAIVIAASVVYGQWQERSVKQYCSELREGMAFEAVAALAERSGLIMPFTESENSDRLMVLNHMSPFFRYA